MVKLREFSYIFNFKALRIPKKKVVEVVFFYISGIVIIIYLAD